VIVIQLTDTHLDTWSWWMYRWGLVGGPPCCVCKQLALCMFVCKAVGLSATCYINNRVVLTVKRCEVQCTVYLTGEAGTHKASHCVYVTRAASNWNKLSLTWPYYIPQKLSLSSTSRIPRLRCDVSFSTCGLPSEKAYGEWSYSVMH